MHLVVPVCIKTYLPLRHFELYYGFDRIFTSMLVNLSCLTGYWLSGFYTPLQKLAIPLKIVRWLNKEKASFINFKQVSCMPITI